MHFLLRHEGESLAQLAILIESLLVYGCHVGWVLSPGKVQGGETLSSLVSGLGLAPEIQLLASADNVAIGAKLLQG